MTEKLDGIDHALKTRVTDELRWSADVDADRVGVAVTQATVMLSGEMTTHAEKQAALDAAYRVHGVTGVVDEMLVKDGLSPHRDADILRAAVRELTAHHTIPAGAVHVTVHDGHVVLSGSLPWHHQRETAERAVRDTPGVKSVHDEIAIRPHLPLAAQQAKSRIMVALVRSARAEAAHISVEAHGTTVELTGRVRTWDEFEQAGDAASSTPGVTSVRNNLRVAP